MNIAILIGINNYKNIDPLPACSNDLSAVQGLFEKLEKYDDILTLDDSISCFDAKQKIINFIEKHKSNTIDEFTLYYSGHGNHDGNVFYYLWADYSESSQNQTSISNSEIDSYIRTLNPEMTFKFIDACQSGSSYIKDNSNYRTLFDREKSNFKKCYFFFSSLSTQSSFASQKISHFTEEFLRFFDKPKDTKVRYRDIKDFLSDRFLPNAKQTPYFIEQADNTEFFCTINDSVATFVQSLPFYRQESDIVEPSSNTMGLIENIKNDAKRFCTKDEADTILKKIYDICISTNKPSNIESLFQIEVATYNEYTELPLINDISKWVSDQEGANLFISIEQTKEPKTFIEKKHTFNIFAFDPFAPRTKQLDDYTEVTRYVDVVTYMAPSCKQQYAYISITFTPQFPNINGFHIYIAIMLSQLDLAIFTGLVNRNRKNWEVFTDDLTKFSWSASKKNIRELIKDDDFFNSFMTKFYQQILDSVKGNFSLNAKEKQ
ncbi:caspase family protein [Desulfovibrio litoralis]|uniref:Caspase domain-containing protein n=1 Tax=Desulfovibrio litoralis DSM 11393 TaxID=1121455 RepID=A0A1M7TLF9_9BACT|nr:caspase family protein [Desulfovibrio litoralis]SHN71463.1 Caspase domain-containing protein [Desulfovibrio litoralis DSM 11393]